MILRRTFNRCQGQTRNFLLTIVGVSTPKGRRGHTALVHRGSMLIYGGYQDLKGSCSELWAYHFGNYNRFCLINLNDSF